MTFIRKSVVLVETHLTLHEGLLALRLLQNVPSTGLPEHLEEDPVLKWMYSKLDLLQEALLAICDLEYDFLTIFRRYHLLRIVSSSMDFWRVQLFQLLKLYYHKCLLSKFLRIQCISEA